MYFEVDKDEVFGKFLYDFKTCQATLASGVGHGTNKGLLLQYSEGESEVRIVLLFDAHLEPDVWLGFGLFPRPFLCSLIEDVVV